MAQAIPIVAAVAGAVVANELAPKPPAPKTKTAGQLAAEQEVAVDRFEQKTKQQATPAGLQASLTRQSLLGNLGGTQSKLGLNTAISSSLRGQTTGGNNG